MIIGFTGTRSGLTIPQTRTFTEMMKTFVTDVSHQFHHGDCVGADAHTHAIIKKEFPHILIHIHPPLQGGYRAYCEGADRVYPEKGYMDRNRAIIVMSEMLIGCPRDMTIRRGGTWYTINEAIFLKKIVYVISPSGEVIEGGSL